MSWQRLFIFFLGKPKAAFAIQRAIFWNIMNLRKTLKKRKRVQNKIRKIDDKELMKSIKRKVRLAYYYYLFTGLEKYED